MLWQLHWTNLLVSIEAKYLVHWPSLDSWKHENICGNWSQICDFVQQLSAEEWGDCTVHNHIICLIILLIRQLIAHCPIILGNLSTGPVWVAAYHTKQERPLKNQTWPYYRQDWKVHLFSCKIFYIFSLLTAMDLGKFVASKPCGKRPSYHLVCSLPSVKTVHGSKSGLSVQSFNSTWPLNKKEMSLFIIMSAQVTCITPHP